MNRATWNPATDPTLPLDTAAPTEWDVVGLFEGTDADIAACFAVMAATPRHRFRAITDRLDRAREWFAWFDTRVARLHEFVAGGRSHIARGIALVNEPLDIWPELTLVGSRALLALEDDGVEPVLPNLMIGTTIRTQADADEKLPKLAAMPARWRFVEVKPSETIDLRHAYAFGGKPVCGGCGHRHGSDPFTGEINNRCWHGSQGLCPCRTWRMPLDLVEIAGGTGPEQLRLVQALAQQVLDAQSWAPCPVEGCIMGAFVDAVPPEGGVAPVCATCNGDAQVMEGPALAIVQADVCVRCCGHWRILECDACTAGATGEISECPCFHFDGVGARTWNQQPVGWLP